MGISGIETTLELFFWANTCMHCSMVLVWRRFGLITVGITRMVTDCS